MTTERSDRLADPTDLSAFLERAAREAARFLEADGAMLYLYDRASGMVRWAYDAGISDEHELAWVRSLEFPVGTGLFGAAIADRRLTVSGDYLPDRRFVHAPNLDDFARDIDLRSLIVAPLLGADGGPLGALGAYSRRQDAFGDADAVLLTALAGHAALAIDNDGLIERLKESQAELQASEARLRESEARYRTLVDHSPDLVWILDSDERFVYFSDRLEAFTGYGPEEFLGRKNVSIVHPDSLPGIAAWLDRVHAGIAGGEIDPTAEQHLRFSLRHRDGSPVPVELRSVGVVVDGVHVGWQAAVRDMREFDRLERELRESESRHRLVTERSPDIMIALDSESRLTFVSERAEALIGWAPDELIGRPSRDVVHPDSRDEVDAAWLERIAEPEADMLTRFLIQHRDGHAIPVEMRSVPIVVDGRFLGAQASIRDVSERDRMERELRRHAVELAASQERAHLAQELHDSVTQALFSITLTTRSVEMLLERDPAGAREKLTELRELGRDALTEMRSLVFELRPGSLEVDGLAVALHKHAAAVQGRTGLPIMLEIEDVPRLPLDLEEAVYRIAQEAIHNVIKHARATQARIVLAAVDGGVRLTVADDGRGFDAKRAARGQGHLGLDGMRARAERAGAHLTVVSRPGAGTEIQVTAPLVRSAE